MYLKSLAGCKTRKRVCCTAVRADWGLSCYEARSEPVSEWLGPAHSAHCSLPARFSRTQRPQFARNMCSILEINSNEEWACGWCGLGMENKKEDTFLSQYSVRSFVRPFVCHDSVQVYFTNMRVESSEMNMVRLLCVWPRTGQVTKQTRARGANPRHNQQSAACGVISWVSAECQLSVSGYPQLLISIVTAGAKQAETARLLAPAPAIRANHRHHQYHT